MASAALIALAACQPAPSAAKPVPSVSRAGLRQVPLTVASGRRTHRFIVEVAASPDEQQRGMMFRQSIAPDRGMIFPFEQPEMATFWMKNTLIPLDLIFIRADGRIANIGANSVPMSTDLVAAEAPVTAVLEIAGGRAAQLGIRAGNRVRWVK